MPFKRKAKAKKSAASGSRRKLVPQGARRKMMGSYALPKMSRTVQPGYTASHVTHVPFHREYIADIQIGTTFAGVAYPVNIALADVFPWAFTIGSNFEKYRFRYLSFVYVPTSATSVGSTNTAQGTVTLTFVPNSTLSVFSNKEQAVGYAGTVSGAPYSKLVCRADLTAIDHPTNAFYTRTGAVPDGQDQRLYDVGQVMVTTSGAQASSTCGELHVVYAVDLITPRQQPGKGGNVVLTDHYQLSGIGGATSLLGTGPATATAGSNLGGVLTTDGKYVAGGSPSGNLIAYTLPPTVNSGLYMYVYSVKGASTALTNAISITLGSNLTGALLFTSGAASVIGATAGETAVRQWCMGCFYPNGGTAVNQNYVEWASGTPPGTITSADLIVTQINPGQVALSARRDAVAAAELKRIAIAAGIDISNWDHTKAVQQVQKTSEAAALCWLKPGSARVSTVTLKEEKHDESDSDDEDDSKVRILKDLTKSSDSVTRAKAEAALLRIACGDEDDEKGSDPPVVIERLETKAAPPTPAKAKK